MTSADRIPVIVGVGEINDRPNGNEVGLDSVELMAAAARLANADAGSNWLENCDWLAITPQISFRDYDVPAMLPKALGIAPATVFQAAIPNGDTPVRHLNDAANAIANGSATVCLLVGGEAIREAVRRAAAAGNTTALFAGSAASASDLRRRYGLITPSDIYPLYENACRAAWGQTLSEGQAESAEIWSRLSQVAVNAEGAWLKKTRSTGEISDINADNRLIAFPYSKLMVANASVNQGAAVFVTSLAKARAAGITDEHLVYIGAGAAAHEDDEPLTRANWTGTVSMEVVLKQVMAFNQLKAADLDHVELYSCFPCVPKLARRVLGLSIDKPLSVHGGLTFGGGPIGNYMLHATAAMVRSLRKSGQFGLLYGNGGHCTHNHAIVLARNPIEGLEFPQNYHVQELADALRKPIPAINDDYEGAVVVETYTVFYNRDGTTQYATVISRNAMSERVLARVDGDDHDNIHFLSSGNAEPVGSVGETRRRGNTLFWHCSKKTQENACTQESRE
jgi:acetyl-CoA C-acetyltransferase